MHTCTHTCIHYADAREAVRLLDFVETIFADDFNCWKELPRDIEEADALAVLHQCQSYLHDWGRANRVVFDPLKEAFVVLRRRNPIGDTFKVLGVEFDAQLLMHKAARNIASEAGWRLAAIFRGRRFFTTPEIIRLYKSHVLSYIESGTAAAARKGLHRAHERAKTAENQKNVFRKNCFFHSFKWNLGGLGVIRRDSLEFWQGLVLQDMGEVDFHVFGKY
jgi:hypothetical protein